MSSNVISNLGTVDWAHYQGQPAIPWMNFVLTEHAGRTLNVPVDPYLLLTLQPWSQQVKDIFRSIDGWGCEEYQLLITRSEPRAVKLHRGGLDTPSMYYTSQFRAMLEGLMIYFAKSLNAYEMVVVPRYNFQEERWELDLTVSSKDPKPIKQPTRFIEALARKMSKLWKGSAVPKVST